MSGEQTALFSDFGFWAAPVADGEGDLNRQLHAYATGPDELPYDLTSPCLGGCCGQVTAGWDAPVLLTRYQLGHPDLDAGGHNQPAYGWVDPACGAGGNDPVPAWGATYDGDAGVVHASEDRFESDLIFMFRTAFWDPPE